MKTYLYVILFTTILWISCNKRRETDCSSIKPKRVFVEKAENNGQVSYFHYILLKNFSKKCFSHISFSNLALRYVDTCSYMKPIGMVVFLESDEDTFFETNEPDLQKASEHEIMSFSITTDFSKPKIKKIYFVRNGVSKIIEIDSCGWKEMVW